MHRAWLEQSNLPETKVKPAVVFVRPAYGGGGIILPDQISMRNTACGRGAEEEDEEEVHKVLECRSWLDINNSHDEADERRLGPRVRPSGKARPRSI